MKQNYEDFSSFVATLDDRGRILVPAPIRKKLKIKFGSMVIARIFSLKYCPGSSEVEQLAVKLQKPGGREFKSPPGRKNLTYAIKK